MHRKSAHPASEIKALQVLEVSTLTMARRRASQVLADALKCTRCRTLLGHVFDRLGSTLFFDDDPRLLAGAFDLEDRDDFASRVLAACIVLSGRWRVVPAVATR